MMIAVVAGKGAPGVTTTALALGLSWPADALVAECDPAGAVLPWRITGAGGRALDPERGVTSLVAMSRTTQIRPDLLLEHAQEADGGLQVLVGPSGPAQSEALGGAGWRRAAELLGSSSMDVIVDCGRLLSEQAVSAPLLMAADAIVVVARPSLEGVAHMRHAVNTAAQIRNNGTAGSGLSRVAVLVVDEATKPGSRRARAREVEAVLEATPGLGDVDVLGILAWDPRTAAAWAGEGQIRRRARLSTTAAQCALTTYDWVRELNSTASQEVSR